MWKHLNLEQLKLFGNRIQPYFMRYIDVSDDGLVTWSSGCQYNIKRIDQVISVMYEGMYIEYPISELMVATWFDLSSIEVDHPSLEVVYLNDDATDLRVSNLSWKISINDLLE